MTTENVAAYPCPACGYLVFDEPSGSYDICVICNWEDDAVQLRFPTMAQGANHESLYDYQKKVLQQLNSLTEKQNAFQRCRDWRPLTDDDLQGSDESPTSGLEYFQAALEQSPTYYWKK